MNPLRAAIREEAFPPCLVIIDALDECKDKNATSTILLSLSAFAGQLAPLKFFITSRPVMKVVQGFRNTDLMKETGAWSSTLSRRIFQRKTFGSILRSGYRTSHSPLYYSPGHQATR